jgi:hypothetical protein
MATAIRAIDRLKNAANLVASRKDVELHNGTIFTFWSRPLTMAERDKAQRTAKSDDANSFALQLLLDKALDEAGQRLFSPADLAELKHEVRDEDLQKLMLSVLTGDEDGEPLEPKSAAGGAK